MGELYDEFEQELASWQARYQGFPEREVEKLLLLALEREQLVTVAYRSELMRDRLRELGIDPELEAAFTQALAWAWKDEEMHAIYTRGLLLKWGSFTLRVRAFVQQMAGAIAGWSSSVQQHVRWSRAPLSRALAGTIATVGRILGKVPRGVRNDLRFLSFREFCRLQVDAERTAAACWNRLSELGPEISRLDESACAEIGRMLSDEQRHCEIFRIIGDGLDGVSSTDEVISRLRAIDAFFVPRAHRPEPLASHPFGSGGRVDVFLGDGSTSKLETFRRVLDESELEATLEQATRVKSKPLSEMRVLVKATFMLGYDREHLEIVTDPELVDALARWLVERGVGDVLVGDGRNIYDRFCENRDVASVASYLGFESPHYRIVDLSADQVPHAYSRGMAQESLSQAWRDADFRIVFSKLRSHPVDFTHLGIGGMQGIGARLEDFLFLERQAHRETALLMPVIDYPPEFALIDGYDSAGDGLVGIIACPNPPRPYRLYAGRDTLAVDMVATRHLGLDDPRESRVLDAACHWFGDPTPTTRVVGCDEPVASWRSPYQNELTTLLSLVANPVYELGSFRGAAFVPPMDEEAFPMTAPGSAIVRFERWCLQRLLRMRR